MRIVAAAVAAATVLAVFLLARRLGRSLTESSLGALLLATAGASPFIESFTLSGELLAALLVVCSLAALTSRRLPGVLVAGLLAGAALTVKQSAVDALLPGLVFLLVRERRLAAPFLVAAAAPLAACAASAASLHAWWYAVVGYRGQGDSLVTGSFGHRLDLLASSLPAAAKALALLAVLAALGWRCAPLLARLWLPAACLGVLGGGNFHAHYYIQLAPPLALLGGIGAARLAVWPRPALAAAAAALVATVALGAPLWGASPAAQAKAVFPQDPHLRTDAALVRYIRAHTRPGQRIFVLWADADLYYLSRRTPAYRYLWYRPLQAIPGALPEARRALAAHRPPALVVEVQRPRSLDPSGATDGILRARYVLAARVAGTRILRPRG